MKLSLVVPTLGRTQALRRLLESLARQSFLDFEVIVVDQGQDAGVQEVVEAFGDSMRLRYVPSATRGASRARNEGLRHASGELVGWPDDDCFYPPDLLAVVVQFFQDHPEVDGLAGRLVDEAGEGHHRGYGPKSSLLTARSFFFRGSETVLFARRSVIERVGGFDESFGTGAGTPWGAGEATDFGIRSLRAGMSWWYWPEARVYHPNPPVAEGDPAAWRKAYGYAQGMGAVLRKSRPGPLFTLYYFWVTLRPVAWALARGRLGRARYHLHRLKGVWVGWWTYPAWARQDHPQSGL